MAMPTFTLRWTRGDFRHGAVVTTRIEAIDLATACDVLRVLYSTERHDPRPLTYEKSEAIEVAR